MDNQSPRSNARNSTKLSLILFAVLGVAGCKLTPLKIDPCAVWSTYPLQCHAVPINQPGKEEYERPLNLGDICVTSDEYAELQKSYREIMRRCGDRCQ